MKWIPVFFLLLECLIGCTVGPNYVAPETALPEQFDLDASSVAEATSNELSWWESFHDPVLIELLHETAQTNPTLAAATARVRVARYYATAAGAALQPSLAAGASALRTEQSKEGLNPLVGTSIPSLPVELPNRTESLYVAGFDAAWELDLFGRQGKVRDSAEARVQAAGWQREDALRSLLAETGRAYIDYRAATARLALLERNIEIATETEDLTQRRFDAGSGTDFDVIRSQAARLSLEAQRAPLAIQIDGALRSLSLLTVLEPGTLRARLSTQMGIPDGSALLGLGLTSSLLERRPDIRAAEQALAAATADLGVATADLYPRFSLVGSLGFESIDWGTFGDAASRFWKLGPKLSAPLFQGGALRARRSAVAEERAAVLAEYQATVLRALREVEGGATALHQSHLEVAARIEAKSAAQSFHLLARKRFDAGVSTLDDLLASETELNRAEEQCLLAQAREATALISLGKALAGGWDQ